MLIDFQNTDNTRTVKLLTIRVISKQTFGRYSDVRTGEQPEARLLLCVRAPKTR